MKDKEIIIEAIESYDIYKPQGKAVLKTLVAASKEDNIARLSVKNLIELSKVSKQGIYNTMRYLENDKLVERQKVSGHRLGIFKLNKEKLLEIVDYYQNLQNTKNILKKI